VVVDDLDRIRQWVSDLQLPIHSGMRTMRMMTATLDRVGAGAAGRHSILRAHHETDADVAEQV
jgi:hypothetical protein